jgi:hypothetical protein
MKTETSTPTAAFRLIAAAVACVAMFYAIGRVHAQTPNLVVSAGSTGQASSLTITSDSANPLKTFTVSGGSGQYNVVWAESSGTAITIYSGTIVASTSGSAGPVTPPAPVNTLPIGALTTSVSAAAAGVDSAALAAMANGYDAVAQQIDTGAIANPTQLYLVTGVQLLSLTADQRTAVQPLTTAVAAWLNTQQTAGRLDETKMADYSRVFHAIAKAMRPGTVTPAHQAPSAKVPSPAENPGGPAAPATPCANGHCPASGPSQPSQSQPAWFRRWR